MSAVGAAFARRWREGSCSSATLALVQWWLRHAPDAHRDVLAAAAGLLQLRQAAGDVAVDLAAWHGRAMPSADDDVDPGPDGLLVPTAMQLHAARGEPWLGDGGAQTLLVWRDGLLLPWRHHRAEERIAAAVRARTAVGDRLTVAAAAATIQRIFARDEAALPQAWQRVAIATVIRNRAEGRRLSVITGGPGTGKTTTVARLLAVLLEHRQLDPAAIRLAAPTGKAADRLAGALRAAITPGDAAARDDLAGCPPLVRAAIPCTTSTIHALLGANPASGSVRYHEGRLLATDLLVIDEASMVDPVLLEAVLAALPPSAHVVLVGDPHQLTSVESGCLLADLCAAAGVPGGYDPDSIDALAPLGLALPPSAAAPQLRQLVCALAYNHRVAAHAPLVRLAQAILAGDAAAALAAADHPGTTALAHGSPQAIIERIIAHARGIQASRDLEAALGRLAGFQVLCALRQGPWGAQTISSVVDRALAVDAGADGWYHGRAVLITVNDRNRGLMNGDVGLCWRDGQGLRVHFPRPHGALSFAPADLPGHQPAWALTIHKSQGSEYAEVHVVMPPVAAHALTMRELLYTAVTRAAVRVQLWATAEVISAAVRTPSGRRSGLVELIAGGDASRRSR
jgi:exodeoxyribonuclease V alpha subunit